MPTRKSNSRKKTSRRGRARSGAARVALIALSLALLGAVAGVGLLSWTRTDTGRARLLRLGFERYREPVQRAVGEALVEVLPAWREASAVDPDADPTARDWPLAEAGPGAVVLCRVLPAPADLSLWEVQDRVARALADRGAEVLWGERLARPAGRWTSESHSGEQGDLLRLDLGVPGVPTHTLLIYPHETAAPRLRWSAEAETERASDLLGPPTQPTVAIVIDDWGNAQNETTRGLLRLDVPLTLSVLPGLPHSRHYALKATELALPAGAAASGPSAEIARARRERGCPVEFVLQRRRDGAPPVRRREVMLHLPMEPQGYPEVNPGRDFVRVGMSRGEIRDLVDSALAGLPGVSGVNNHMGSAATADAATMERVMDVLADHGLFFLDSKTTSHSVAEEAARAAGMSTLGSRLFLDQSDHDPARIRALMARLVKAARATGGAVGIGHPYPETLAVLAEELPRYRREGIRFVTVSELLALRRERDMR